jgi:hypothetical protein
MSPVLRTATAVAAVLFTWTSLVAQDGTPSYQGEAAEQFLRNARITRIRSVGQGVTGPRRATLERDGTVQDAVLKDVIFMRPGVTQLDDGTVIFNMEDSWRFEVAAYRIDRMIGLGLVPATVERDYRGTPGSLQWWVESEWSEAARRRDNIQPPDAEDWDRQLLKMRLFDNLLFNWDRHTNNILITKDFQLRLIDHSRAFLAYSDLRRPEELTRFSRSLLAGMERLTRDDLRRQVGRYIEGSKINALLERRDKILALARTRVSERGEDAVFYP